MSKPVQNPRLYSYHSNKITSPKKLQCGSSLPFIFQNIIFTCIKFQNKTDIIFFCPEDLSKSAAYDFIIIFNIFQQYPFTPSMASEPRRKCKESSLTFHKAKVKMARTSKPRRIASIMTHSGIEKETFGVAQMTDVLI